MAECGGGRCWYEGQGFTSCYKGMEASECVLRCADREVRRRWVCPECDREVTALLSVNDVYCEHNRLPVRMEQKGYDV